MSKSFSVTKNGVALDPNLYIWDEKTKTFSTNEDDLVIDFRDWDRVTFNTDSRCAFMTGSDCTFDTGNSCTFDTGYSCTFTVRDNCVIVRRDVFEVIQPQPNVTIKLYEHGVKGYKVVEKKHVITIDGKAIELSQESFESLKNWQRELKSEIDSLGPTPCFGDPDARLDHSDMVASYLAIDLYKINQELKRRRE